MKVLIVDEDWRFSLQASIYLESRAHSVVRQPKPTDAVAQANHWHPDLVILSADAANKGGIDGLMTIKERPAVLLTGQLDQYHVAWRAWQKGGDELLMKPVLHCDELHEAIVTAMENATAGTRKIKHARASA